MKIRKIVNLSRVYDLLGVLHSLPKRTAKITAVCRVLGPANTPQGYTNSVLNQGVQWVRVGLLFGNIQLSDDVCADNKVLWQIKNMQGAGVFYGCANVALPQDYTCYLQGNNDLVISGKAYADKLPDTQVNILQWSVEGGNSWIVNAAEIHPVDLTNYTDGLRALYMRLQRSSMSDLIKTLYNVSGIVPCGVGIKACIQQVVFPPETMAYWETTTDELVVMSEVERTKITVHEDTLLQAVPETCDLGFTTEKEISSGIVQRNGRLYYNRKKFAYNETFVDRLFDILKQKQKQLSNTVIPEMFIQSDIANRFGTNLINGIRTSWVRVAESAHVLTGNELCEQVFGKAVDAGLFDELQKYVGTEDTGSLARLKIQINLLMSNTNVMFRILGYWREALQIHGVPAIEFSKLHSDIMDIDDKFVHGFAIHICENAEQFLLLFLQEVLHLNCDLLRIQKQLHEYIDEDVTIWRLMPNPYLLAYYGLHVNISDLDILAMVMGVFNRENVQKARMVVFMHNAMCDTTSSFTNGSTMVERKRILAECKYMTPVTEAEKKSIQADGLHLAFIQRLTIQTYLGIPSNAENYKVNKLFSLTYHWGRSYKTSIRGTLEMLTEYCDSPLGVVIQQDGVEVVIDTQLLDKECACYSNCAVLSEFSDTLNKVSQATINRCISEFEKLTASAWGISELKLEYKQRQVAEYVNSTCAAVVGGAGTGKTTSAALLLYTLQTTRGIKDEEVLFIAPTGKAAVRLKESVKRPTMTIHRACSLEYSTGAQRNENSLHKYKAIFVDECSLISLNLMVALLQAISNGTHVYFFGDIAQLPAIDIGKPFALMLHYIPCVTLEVSKRATEGSLITRNSNILMSSETAPLSSGSNYIIADVPEVQAMAYVEAICRYHLYGERDHMWRYIDTGAVRKYTTNDLMVVTPVKNKKYAWGCSNLNARLQNVYNRVTDDTAYVYTVDAAGKEEQRYYVGDKVVHLTNQAQELRYQSINENSFIAITDKKEFCGVMNGELGIIRYIVDGANIKFVNTELDLNENSEIAKRMQQKRSRKMYMFVEYTDVDVETSKPVTYLICYPLTKRTNSVTTDVNGVCVEKDTIHTIELAYALTVHKLEGSEAPITICLCYDVNVPYFMNNNLLQTMLTRASEGVYLIGDMRNAFSKARKTDALKLRKSIFDSF